MSFFTFFTFWFDEDLGGGEEEILFFKKEWNLKNGLLIFTFGFWDKKRKLLLWNSLYFSFTLFHLFDLKFEKIPQLLSATHFASQSHHRVIWRVT